MAGKNNLAEPAKATAKSPAPKKYTVERLRANCLKLFGVTTSTFAGATYGMTGTYTVEEMKANIEAWKKKEVN